MSTKVMCGQLQIDLAQFIDCACEDLGDDRTSREILELLISARGTIWDVIEDLAYVAIEKAKQHDEIATKCDTTKEADWREKEATDLRETAKKLRELSK